MRRFLGSRRVTSLTAQVGSIPTTILPFSHPSADRRTLTLVRHADQRWAAVAVWR